MSFETSSKRLRTRNHHSPTWRYGLAFAVKSLAVLVAAAFSACTPDPSVDEAGYYFSLDEGFAEAGLEPSFDWVVQIPVNGDWTSVVELGVRLPFGDSPNIVDDCWITDFRLFDPKNDEVIGYVNQPVCFEQGGTDSWPAYIPHDYLEQQ